MKFAIGAVFAMAFAVVAGANGMTYFAWFCRYQNYRADHARFCRVMAALDERPVPARQLVDLQRPH